ncbi:MAG: dTDP-4-dehydrorhamnose 3,5-epimerase [Bacteroidales bacterium]
MKFTQQNIPGVWVIEPKVYNDARVYFSEVFKQDLFEQHIGKLQFVQDNESKSSRGVLRGLHFQKGTYSQAKLVRVILGRVLDVAVDLRQNSPHFGQYVAVELSEENKKQFFIPRGFAHGFLVLSPEAVFTYKVDNVYAPQEEGSLNYADPELGIPWPIPVKELVLSPKDAQAPLLKEAYTFPGLLP